MNIDEIEIDDAEARAIKEAEYIAASESQRLVQELSLRLDLSEPNSKVGSRIQSSTEISIENDENNDKQEENVEIQNKIACEPIIMSDENSNENENEINLISQESKLVLSEFKNDFDNSMMEQEEKSGNSDSECDHIDVVIIEESKIDESENTKEEDENNKLLSVYENNEEFILTKGCTVQIGNIKEYAKSSCDQILDIKKSLISNIKMNVYETNETIKKSSVDYFNTFHSKLILMAGLHSPDDCSICKEFRRQDVPLLN
ncbi:hypothetical protein FG386_003409 [Cryptosporidium ryanae]|uniref:uncharacterized protein n=1 Tax=Cryptosporidium ryanae TaxID=515981 RepID=UPI00351A6E12|nr:hypothetical protein FG386_003409 [Cryptosporidium ryanae]